MWPANDAVRFRVGRCYRVRTKSGDVVTGRCAMSSAERAVLVSDAGLFTVWTGAVLQIDNLEPE